MKSLRTLALYALTTPAIALGASSAMAQQITGPEADRSFQVAQQDQDKARSTDRRYFNTTPASASHANNLVGATVKTTGGEEIGTVGDLIIDKNGQVIAIVVGVGGFLGMGEKDVAIGWEHVTRSGSRDDRVLHIDVTGKELRAAPSFNKAD